MTKKYNIEVDCANCAAKMEDAISKVAGVKEANINFMALTMTVTYQEGASVSHINQEIIQTCRKIERDFSLEE